MERASSDVSTEFDNPAAVAERASSDVFDHAALMAHLASLRREAAALDIDLDAALRDPRFVRLTAPGQGVGVADAWYALHREEEQLAQRRALAAAVSAGRERPREGGGEGAALRLTDAPLSPERRRALRRQIYDAAARGEKIYP